MGELSMKTIKELIAVLFISSNFVVHAQTEAAAQAEAPDSMVRIAAEARGLSQVSPAELPCSGTFWVQNVGALLPYPSPFYLDSTNLPVFSLGGSGQFLVDATGGVLPQPTSWQAQHGITTATLLDRQGNAVLDLIGQVQAARQAGELAMAASPVRVAHEQTVAVEQAWLADEGALTGLMAARGLSGLLSLGCTCSCTCATGGQVYFTNASATITTNEGMVVSFGVAGGTNGVVYGIFTTTNLANPQWKWVENVYTCSSVYLTNQPAGTAFYALGAVSPTMIVPWGDNASGQSVIPLELTNAVAVAGGDDYSGTLGFSIALRSDGRVVAWGDGSHGQTNVPATLSNAVAIAANVYHGLALRFDGTVTNWGSWQTVDTNNNNIYPAVSVPSGLTNVIGIAAGVEHDLALHCDGSVTAWGYYTDDSWVLVPTNLPPAKAVAAGWYHSVALLTNGTVTVWGYNWNDIIFGGLGITNVPAGLSNVTAIVSGAFHTLALKADGTVTAWGATSFFNEGQSTVPAGLSNVVEIAAGLYYSMALKSDGTVVMWGNGLSLPGYQLNQLTGIGAGWRHALAIRSRPLTPIIVTQPVSQIVLPGTNVTFSVQALVLAGTTYQWQIGGVNIPGATNANLTLTNVTIAAQGIYSAILSNNDGSTTSSNATLTIVTPPVITAFTLLTNYVVIYPNLLTFSVTVTAPGQSAGFPVHYQWQLNGTDLPSASATFSNYNSVGFASGIYTVIITNAAGSTNISWQVLLLVPSALVAWGADTFGQTNVSYQPSVASNFTAIAAGEYHSIGVRDDGRVSAWGSNAGGQTNVPASLSNVAAVAAGAAHNLALKADGTVIAWGRNDFNQTNVPSAATNILAISAGGQQSLALKKDGTVIQWGQTNAPVPAGLTNIIAIASGTNFHLALLSNTTVVVWGANDYGQTNLPANLSNVVAIAAGGSHALALADSGTVVAWGSLTNVPAGLSNVLTLAAGYAHSVALKNDGAVVAWGDNSAGQTNVPSNLPPVKLIAAGGAHTLAQPFSTRAQYPVDVTKDLLLIYNTNSTDSIWVKDYYLAHRPMISSANVLPIGCAPLESVKRADFTNTIRQPILNWLNANPTKRPQFWVIFLDIPSRINEWTNANDYHCIVGAPVDKSVSYELYSTMPNNPFVTHLNIHDTNGCRAYIDKLEYFGTNYSLGKVVISASAGGYGNTNYYFDECPQINGAAGLARSGVLGVTPSASIVYSNGNDFQTNLAVHITKGANVSGYFSYGAHSALGSIYPINTNWLSWYGNSGWWIIETIESFNGQWTNNCSDQGNVARWFSATAFGGTNYSFAPIGAVSHTDEPFSQNINDPFIYFGLWEARKNFAICAWNSRRTPFFQAVGDPFVCK